jgi:FtsZ-binding cell division protein ZapB
MDNTINGRTPDEIKKGLEYCCGMHDHSYCRECPYSENDCDEMSRDALALIQQFERERDEVSEFHKELVETNNNLFAEIVEMQGEINALRKELEQVKRERDAAVKALRGDCRECAHRGKWDVCADCIYSCPFEDEGKKDNWQWSGVQEVK